MSDLLSDFLNDRIEPVPRSGVVNGVMDYELSDDDWDKEPSSGADSDSEQKEYVKKELESYLVQEEEPGGMTDIEEGREESELGTEFLESLSVPKAFDKYKFDTYSKKELPIDSFREKILNLINTNYVVIIHGPTGCGKTTQVPQYILDQCRTNKQPCNIVVTQPRRIAAINISQRVCEERGWSLGTVCGYQVGLDKNAGEDVVLTYVTTEVLLQRLIVQKNLNKFTHIIIDEVHERTKTLDFLLLIVRKYLYTNSPGVKVILMSATMEANEFAYYFRWYPRSDPKQYIVPNILHVNKESEYTTSIYYNEQFASQDLTYNIDEPCITPAQYELCSKLICIFDNLDSQEAKEYAGSVLVFLPGFHEIEEMNRILLAERAPHVRWDIIPLHSSLSSEHMAKAFKKPLPNVRKIILSTNIAESSVTVPDVNYVVDFCLTKIMVVNETTKFASLSLQWASHNNCVQRAGRVGRVANGRVYRLVPYAFYTNQMQPNSTPELQRAPLENIILYMKLLELNDTPKNVLSLAISPPNLKDVENCIWHLKEVGALLQTCRGKQSSADGDITFLGRVMGNLPIDIHLSKLIVLGHMFSCLDETVIMAAGCTTRNVFVSNFRDRFKCYRRKLVWADGSLSDFMIYLNLFDVWLKAKRENAFRSPNEEYTWCKTNFVNLKGIREWDLLIKELHARLKKLQIEKSMRAEHRVHMNEVQRSYALKVIICGAFYPNYFVRSGDYGQIDSKEAVRILSGREPRATVYFTNMKLNQPGQIYVRQIKKLINAENNPNVQIGFDSQSAKVYVEYKNFRTPEAVNVGGMTQLYPGRGNTIAVDVYEAVRKRQLRMSFELKLLSDAEAWTFANKIKSERQNEEELCCFSTIDYCPFPSLDIEYMTVKVSHVQDVGHFYCQNWNEETNGFLDKIFMALNGPGVFLEPVLPTGKVKLYTTIYAAMYNQDSKFYRCKVLMLQPEPHSCAQVQFIDYGNIQRVPLNRIYKLPDKAECRIAPIAMCCVLSEVQPSKSVSISKGTWSEQANRIFKQKTDNVLLDAKVYSVVNDTVYLELYRRSNTSGISLNQWLIDEGHAEKAKESCLSQGDHDLRCQVLSSEDPNNYSKLLASTTKNESYTDFQAPKFTETSEVIQLKGPFSPLEMKVCGLVRASLNSAVHVDGDSVNAVLLDENMDDPHATLLVAGQVAQSATSKNININQTSMMPCLAGFPMLMTMLFCPKMEPKPTEDGYRIASILCGLGYKEHSEKPNFPMHDISLVLDTELTEEISCKVNEMRYTMNRAIKIMNNIYNELAYPDELAAQQKKLNKMLTDLLHMKQKSVDRVYVKHADTWNKPLADLEILKMQMNDEEEDDIWPLLWFVQLNKDNRYSRLTIDKNLNDLLHIAKRMEPEQKIKCELCGSDTLDFVNDVRMHLLSPEHKANLAQYKQE